MVTNLSSDSSEPNSKTQCETTGSVLCQQSLTIIVISTWNLYNSESMNSLNVVGLLGLEVLGETGDIVQIDGIKCNIDTPNVDK